MVLTYPLDGASSVVLVILDVIPWPPASNPTSNQENKEVKASAYVDLLKRKN